MTIIPFIIGFVALIIALISDAISYATNAAKKEMRRDAVNRDSGFGVRQRRGRF